MYSRALSDWGWDRGLLRIRVRDGVGVGVGVRVVGGCKVRDLGVYGGRGLIGGSKVQEQTGKGGANAFPLALLYE